MYSSVKSLKTGSFDKKFVRQKFVKKDIAMDEFERSR